MPYIDWMGKDDVKDHHKSIEYKTIECKEDIGDIDSENMIIKGDNLLALKSLLPYYASSVKMIYIDPPYNTGNTSWVYNDNMDSPLIKKWLNDTVNADDLSRSDKWLCMMYPRLKLLRELLKDDGVIFISIDDAEVAHLRMICDEIFGKDNFITEIMWKRKKEISNDSNNVSVQGEYILVYGKSSNAKLYFERLSDEYIDKSYSNPTKEYPLDKWRPVPITVSKGLNGGGYEYPIKTPSGKVHNKLWAYPEDSYEKLLANKKVYFGKNNDAIPQRVAYLFESKGKPTTNYWDDVATNKEGKKETLNIFGDNLFDTPKSVILIKKILQLTTLNNDIILDSFAGSGTTAQAVLEQNKEDGGNRKFILIETLDYAKDITAERVKRVIKGYDFTGKDKTTLYEKKLTTTQILKPETMEKISKEVNKILEDEKQNYTTIKKSFNENILKVEGIKDIKSFKDGIGGGFKYCELSHDIFDEFGELNTKLTFDQIAKHIYFVEFKKPIDKANIKAPFVGTHKYKYIYFYENKFLKRDMKELIKLNNDYKQIIVYTARTTISDDELKDNNIIIRYIPYDIKDN
jgi:adenine-specific DNA-methyltransferase